MPAIKLHKINSRFEKHLTNKYNSIVTMIRDFVNADPQMNKYRTEGVTHYLAKLVKDFYRFLKANLVES